ncbi:BapA/Bap/LapF family prefix-like domain-containing protein [Pantoea sp.]|uniref:BapA/Bap/LapF family prefix-like domain-containing protein n=1 Tax=Pantoea sp. TaxID=69393 RepID=UPI0028AC8447|nr:BapA prefix-like domain-containing protein [Pantoea sp.]
MAFSGTGRFTVVSLTGGQPLFRQTQNMSSFILSEPAIVTLQGLPSQVTSYHRQWDDLILNLKESDTLRYQNFFTDVAGHQSKLLFQQGDLLQQAKFSTEETNHAQTLTTLTPVLHAAEHTDAPASTFNASTVPLSSEVTNAESRALTGAETVSENIAVDTETTSGSAASTSTFAQAAETAPALSAATEDEKADAIVLPALTLDPVTGDNAVSYKEGIYGVTLTGTASHLPSGTAIELTLDGRVWQGSVSRDRWQVDISDSELKTIKDGNYSITVSAADADGNSTSLTHDLLLITHYGSSNPKVTVNPVTLADAFEYDGETRYVLSGTLEAPLPINSFMVQVYDTFHWNTVVVRADGSWRAEISASELSEGGNSLVFGVLDGAGNWFEKDGYVTADLTTPVDAGSWVPPVHEENPSDGGTNPPDGGDTPVSAAPVLTIRSFTGDGVLSAEEKLLDQTLSGTLENMAEGSTLTVMLNGQSYTTALAADGSWSVTLPAADLQVLPAGAGSLSVSFENSVGGTTTASKAIAVEASAPPSGTLPPQPVIDTPLGDGYMNAHERFEPVTLRGTTGVTGAGQRIVLSLDGVDYAGTVDSEGNWQVSLSRDQLIQAELTEGSHSLTLTATDLWGQTGVAEATFITDTLDPSVTIRTLSGDGLIDRSEISQPLVIAGSGEAGSTLEVTFGDLHWSEVIGQSGQWQFTVPAETLQAMGEGSYRAAATITDAAGNRGYASSGVEIYASEALPALTLDPVTGDNAVSYKEGIYGVTLTGTASHLPSGTAIELTLDGRVWQGSVSRDRWQVDISDSELKTIKDGNYSITVSAADADGNSTSLTHDLLLITHYGSSNPKVTVNPVTLADAVQHDGETWYVLSGTLEAPLPLNTFSVQVDDTFHWNKVTIQPDGSWRAEISASELSEGGNHLTFGVLDGAGNWFEQGSYVTADLTSPVTGNGGEPVPAMDTPFGDGLLSRAEKKETETLTGTTGITGSGQTVTINIGGKHHAATVSDDGHWSLSLTPGMMKTGFGKGQHDIVVTATDAAGHSATMTTHFQVEACKPKIAASHLADSSQVHPEVSHDPRPAGMAETHALLTMKAGEHQSPSPATSQAAQTVQPEISEVQHSALSGERLIAGEADGHVNVVSDSSSASDRQTGIAHVVSPEPATEAVNPLFGTESSDAFSFSLTNLLARQDNVVGHDTLPLNATHDALDFATLGLKAEDNPAIDLGAFSNHGVTPVQTDLSVLTSGAMTLTGADGNVVTLSHTEGGVWNLEGARTPDSHQGELYPNGSVSHQGTLADILNQHNQHQQLA